MRIEQHPGFGRLLLLVVLLNLLAAQILHESGHWAVMQAFGRRPLWGFTSLVQMSEEPTAPEAWTAITNLDGSRSWLHTRSAPASDAEWLLFLAAGPLFQLAAVGIGFIIARRGRSPAARTIGFLVALVNAFGGFFYQVVGLLRGSGGDEVLIGHYLGISPAIVSALLGIGFGIGLVTAFRALETRRTRLTWGATLFLGTLPVGPLLMIANQAVIAQVDAGNPFFRSVLGFSLPVFLAGVLCFIGLAFMTRHWRVQASPA
jgi:hypothetical protein